MSKRITKNNIKQAFISTGNESLDPLIIFSRTRLKNILDVRVKIICELRRMGFSYPEIGRAVGRNHTTVLHLVRKYGQ